MPRDGSGGVRDGCSCSPTIFLSVCGTSAGAKLHAAPQCGAGLNTPSYRECSPAPAAHPAAGTAAGLKTCVVPQSVVGPCSHLDKLRCVPVLAETLDLDEHPGIDPFRQHGSDFATVDLVLD